MKAAEDRKLCALSVLKNGLIRKVSFVKELVEDNKVLIFSKTLCPYCKATLKTFDEARLPVGLVRVLQLDKLDDGSEIQDALYEFNGLKTVPNV